MSVREVAARARSSAVAPAVRARSALQLTQSFFFAALAICLLIAHGHVAETDGISYYGVHPPTMPALFLAYLVGAAGLWWTGAQLVAAGAPGWTLWALRYVAVGLVVLLATPYNQGTFFNWAHMSVGVAMALVAQIALGLGAAVATAQPRGGHRNGGGVLRGSARRDLAARLEHRADAAGRDPCSRSGSRGACSQWTHALEAQSATTAVARTSRARQPLVARDRERVLALERDLTEEERVPDPRERDRASSRRRAALVLERLDALRRSARSPRALAGRDARRTRSSCDGRRTCSRCAAVRASSASGAWASAIIVSSAARRSGPSSRRRAAAW